MRPRLWVWWIVVVWAISFPWNGFTPRPQWHRVHPVPFSDPADKPRDLFANVVLFVPFGYSWAKRRGAGAALAALPIAAAVSMSAEALQLFGTERYPSGTDVLAAVAGAVGGTAIALVRRKSPA